MGPVMSRPQARPEEKRGAVMYLPFGISAWLPLIIATYEPGAYGK
jgi:hypothetical protein